ncbi:MAG: ABC transporter substrate-binding protein [Actinomycetaceae bacterium]|nr:ABC transporter substrate-binding protein [Actinomycetaceae bacterium]
MIRRCLVATVAVASVLLQTTLLTACAPTDRLSFVCSNDEKICEQWKNRFAVDTGIETQYQRLPTSEALARIQAARSHPEFDLWVGGPSENYVVAASKGLLASYTPAGVEDIPAQYRDPNGRWYGVYASILALCSNPDLLQELGKNAPQSWKELEDPAWRSWISGSSPLTSGTAFSALWAQARIFPDPEAHLQAVYSNITRYTHSGTAPAAVVARGEAAVAISFAPYCQQVTSGSGQSLNIHYPREGTAYEVGAGAVLAKAHNPESAQRMLDWLTSRPGQEIISDNAVGQIPISRQLPHHLEQVLASSSIKVLPSDVNRAAQERERWLSWFSSFQTQVQ